jgi:RHS repeat-associated protein
MKSKGEVVRGTKTATTRGTGSPRGGSALLWTGEKAPSAALRRRPRAWFVALASASVLLLALSAGAQTFTLAPSGDTHLRSGSANQAYGTLGYLRIQDSGNNRALVQFSQTDIANRMAGGTLISATLRLYIEDNGNNWGTTGGLVGVHRVTSPWTDAGATWNCPSDSNPSNSSPDCTSQWGGGAYVNAPAATATHVNNQVGWVEFDVTGEVAAFSTGTSNSGWLLRKLDEGSSGRVNYTSKEGAAAQAPQLVLVVEKPNPDTVAPRVTVTSPKRGVVIGDATPLIAASFVDQGSGVDPSSFRVRIDGTDLSSGCSAATGSGSCEAPTLAAGPHAVAIDLRDLAGNLRTTSFTMTLYLGAGPHSIAVPIVEDTFLRQGSPNQNQGAESYLRDRDSGNNRSLVRVDGGWMADILDASIFVSARLELYIQKNGDNWSTAGRTVDVHRMTAAWKEMTATWNCGDDTNVYNSQPDCATSWNGGSYVATPTASVLQQKYQTGWTGWDVTADVTAFRSGSGNFGWMIRKTDEGQAGLVEYTSREGVEGQRPRLVLSVRPSGGTGQPPTVAITTPSNGAVVGGATLTLSGTASADATSVSVNGWAASLTGGSWSATVPLASEGNNTLTATARNAANLEGSASVVVVRDTVGPILAISSPTAAQKIATSTTTVTGTVSDPHLASVSVEGLPASVSGGVFTAVGVPLTEGTKTLTATALDSVGNPTTASVTVEVDSLAPVVSLDPPAESLVGSSSLTLTGSVSDPHLQSVTVGGNPAVATGNRFSVTVSLVEGTQSFVAKGTDSFGHSADSNSVSVTLDSQPPELALDGPTLPTSGCFASGSTVTLSGSYSDSHPPVGSAPISADLRRSDGSTATLSASVGSDGRSWSIPNVSLGTDDGRASVTLSATDRLGRSSRLLRSWPVDATTPTIELSVDGAPFPGAQQGETVLPTDPVETFGRSIAPRAFVRDGAAATPPSATWTLDGSPYTEGTAIDAEGEHLLVARATDCAVHVGGAHVRFRIDRTAVALLSTVPADGALLNAAVTTFSGTASGDLAFAKVNGLDATVTPGSGSTPARFVLAPFAWREGTNSVAIELVDSAGNRATFSRGFSIRTLAPSVEVLESGGRLLSGSTFARTVVPVLHSNDSAATLSATLDGAPFASGSPVSSEGPHTLVATATASGLSSSATVLFTIDRSTPPTIAITSPEEGATLPGPTVTVTGTVSASVVSVSVNGVAAVVSGGSFTASAVPLEPDVLNDLMAVARDATGRQAMDVRTVLVRSGAPRVLILDPPDGFVTNRARIDLVGTVVGGASTLADGLVRIGGLSAPVDAAGGFRVKDVPLVDGINALTVSGTDSHGRAGSGSILVVSDPHPPSLAITAGGTPVLDGTSFTAPFTLRVEASDNRSPAPTPTVRLNGSPIVASGPTVEQAISSAAGYVLSVVVRDAAGNETRAERSFLLDLGGCSLSDVEPADGSSTGDASIAVHGRSGSAAEVRVRVESPTAGKKGSATRNALEYQALLADGTFAASGIPLVVGDNVLSVVCRDRAGNESTVSRTVRRLAGSGPEVTITSPERDSTQSPARVEVQGTVSDASASVTVNGQAATVTASVGGAGTFQLAGAPLAEGPNVVVARAVDAAGRIGEDRVVVRRDSASPKVQIASPASGARIGRLAASGPVPVEVVGQIEPGSEPSPATVTVVGSTSKGSVPATVDASGRFVASGVLLDETVPATSPQTITVAANDGRNPAGVARVEVYLDLAGPALSLSAPADLTRVTEPSVVTVAVAGRAVAAEGGAVIINGGTLEPTSLIWGAPRADGRRETSFATTIPVPSSDGAFQLLVRVDEPGGRAATARRLLVRDTKAPSVVETVPATGATDVSAHGILLILFSEEIDAATLGANDGLRLFDASDAPVIGTFTVAGSAVAFTPAAALRRGASYRFRAGLGIADLAGHSLASASEVGFVVEVDPTEAAPTLDPLPAVFCADSVVVRGTSAPGGGIRVRDGELRFSGTADSTGRFAVEVPLSTGGFHELEVVALSRNGTSESRGARALLRVDCGGPSVTAASFDRVLGRISVSFGEPVAGSSLTIGGPTDSIRISDAGDGSGTLRPGAVALSGDGVALTIDLDPSADAWWRSAPVRFWLGPPATDRSGNPMGAPFETVFSVAGETSGGFLFGEAYDDATGRPLSGVAANLFLSGSPLPGSASPASPVASAASDGRGRFQLMGELPAGRYALVLERTGYTRVVRRMPLEPSIGAVAFDSHLTPLAAASASALAPATGGSLAGPAGSGLSLVADPAALPGSASLAVRLTRLSDQALPELLPLGWTPLAAADVRLEKGDGTPLPEGLASPFAAGRVRLTISLDAAPPTGASLQAVRYDLESGLWLTLPAPTVVSNGTTSASFPLAGPGTVALVVADTLEAIRPKVLPAGAGEGLVGADLPASRPPLAGSIALTPGIISPTGRAAARVEAWSTAGTPWPSGLAVQAYLDEKLVLASGAELLEAPFSTDLVLYHSTLATAEAQNAPAGSAGAMTFQVSPSPRAAQVLLETGYENIRIFPFPEQLERGQILGPAGGSADSSDGVELILSEGALSDRTVVQVRALSPTERQAYSVAGFDLLGAIEVDLGGRTLARPGALRLRASAGVEPDSVADPRTIVALWNGTPADGRGAFARLAARAHWLDAAAGERPTISATPEPAVTDLPLDGIDREGIYLVLRAQAPLAFATGFVRAGSGIGFEGARVRTAGLGTADLSRLGGRYAIPVPVAGGTIEALHPTLDEKGTATIASPLAAGAVASLDIVIRPVGPSVGTPSPANGAVDVPVRTLVTLLMSESIDATSVSSTSLRLELGDSEGKSTGIFVDGSASLAVDGRTIVFTPRYPLSPGRTLIARFAGGVRDLGGTPYEGPVPFLWSFRTSTAVVTATEVHPEKFHLRMPSNGQAELVTDSGAVPSGWLVVVEIEGPVAETSPFQRTADSNGQVTGFVGAPPAFPVTIATRLWARVWNPADPEVPAERFRLGPFASEDGKTFVAPAGEETVFVDQDSNEVTVPDGTFDLPTEVRIETLPGSALGISLEPPFTVGRLVRLDFDGEARKSLRVRVPAPAEARSNSVVLVGRPIGTSWGARLRLIDLAKVVDDPVRGHLLSNAEGDRPTAEEATGRAAREVAPQAECDPACRSCDPTCLTCDPFCQSCAVECLRCNPTCLTCDPRCKSCESCDIYHGTLLELTTSGQVAFVFAFGAEFSVVAGNAPADLAAQDEFLYTTFASQFVFLPPPNNWSGRFVLPAIAGQPFSIVRRDGATGWIVSESPMDVIAAGSEVTLVPPLTSAAETTPPLLVSADPLEVAAFRPASVAQRAFYGIEAGAIESGTIEVRAVDAEPLATGTRLQVLDTTRGGSVCGGLSTVAIEELPCKGYADPDDDLVAILSPGDIDPSRTSDLRFVFSRPIDRVSSIDLTNLVTVLDCGERGDDDRPCAAPADGSALPRVLADVAIEGGYRVLSVKPKAGHLTEGHRFRVVLERTDISACGGEASLPTCSYPSWAPDTFELAVRRRSSDPIDRTDNAFSDLAARDLMRIQNVLFAALDDGELLAFDTGGTGSPREGRPGTIREITRSVGPSQLRTFATDGHNRLFYTGQFGAAWTLRAVRFEDVVKPPTPPCSVPACRFDPVEGAIRVAWAIDTLDGLSATEYTALAGSLPTGIPSRLELVVEDDVNPDPRSPQESTAQPAELDLDSFFALYRPTADAALEQFDPDGNGTFELSLKLPKAVPTTNPPEGTCDPKAEYRYQRATVENLSTGQSWSFDMPLWSSDPGGGEAFFNTSESELPGPIVARRGDRLQLRRNVSTLGYMALLGSGITVLDLNRMYRAPIPVAGSLARRVDQCSRRIGRFEGDAVVFPSCSAIPGGPSASDPLGLAMTPSVAARLLGNGAGGPASQTVDVLSPLLGWGLVDTNASGGEPGTLSLRGEPICLRGASRDTAPTASLSGPVVKLRDIAIARGAKWLDRHRRRSLDGSILLSGSENDDPTTATGDLAFVTAGPAGVLVFDLGGDAAPSDPVYIGRLAPKEHWAYRLLVDEKRSRLLVGGTRPSGTPFIDVYRLADVNGWPDPEGNDLRAVSTVAAPWTTDHIAIDSATGLLYTWGKTNPTDGGEPQGARVVPIDSPTFTFAGIHRAGDPATPDDPVPIVDRVASSFVPLGVPLFLPSERIGSADRVKKEKEITPAFRLRTALPGGLGDRLIAEVESLRAPLPSSRLGEPDAGVAAAPPPFGCGSLDTRVRVTLRKKESAEPSAQLESPWNLYESEEIVLLVADPRAADSYYLTLTGEDGDDAYRGTEAGECRNCERPSWMKDLAGTPVVELFSGGPYLRAFLLPSEEAPANQAAATFFAEHGESYPPPVGLVRSVGWGDDVGSPSQVAGLESPANPPIWSLGEAGASVALLAGEAMLEATDYATSGRGLPFSLDRHYRSGRIGYGPFGSAGWTSPLFAHLREIPTTGEVELHDGTGQLWRFLPRDPDNDQCLKSPRPGWGCDSQADYDPPLGLYLRLLRVQGGWRLLGPNNDSMIFDGAGRLVELRDRFRQTAKDPSSRGNTIRLQYDGFGRLVRAEDDLQRSYSFDWWEDASETDRIGAGIPVSERSAYLGLLRRMTDFMPEGGEKHPRRVEYRYDSLRRLVEVRLPELRNGYRSDALPESFDYTDDEHDRPAVRYAYTPTEIGRGGLLHGCFSGLRIKSMTRPGHTVERVVFGWDPSSGRVSTVDVPASEGQSSRPTWTFLPAPALLPPSGVAVVRLPWADSPVEPPQSQPEVRFDLLGSRLASVTQTLPAFPSSEAGRRAWPPSPVEAVTRFGYYDDGRILRVTRPDGSFTESCHQESSEAGGFCSEPGVETRERFAYLARAVPVASFEHKGGAPAGRAAYQLIAHRAQLGEDNVPVATVDPLGRRTALGSPSASQPESKQFVGWTEPNPPSGDNKGFVGGSLQWDSFGRPTRFAAGENTLAPPGEGSVLPSPPSSAVVGFNFHPGPKDRPGAGFLAGITRGEPSAPKIEAKFGYAEGDPSGNVVSKTTSFGTESRYEYDDLDRVVREESGNLASGRPAGAKPLEPVNGVVERAFDPVGNLVRERRTLAVPGPGGSRETKWVETRYRYDERERLFEVWQTHLAAGSPGGDLLEGLGLLTRRIFDRAGRLDREENGLGQGASYGYDSAGRVAAVTPDGLGKRHVGYDEAGRAAFRDDGHEGIWSGRYDAWGRLWQERHPSGAVVEREFDEAGGLTAEILLDRPSSDPLALRLAETRTRMTPFGSLDWAAELLEPSAEGAPGKWRLSRRFYDLAGRLVEEKSSPLTGDPSGSPELAGYRLESHFEYEPETGRLSERRDAAGNRTVLEYDAGGFPWPLRSVARETVPGLGLQETVRSSFSYDALGRVTREERNDGSWSAASWDFSGGKIREVDGAGAEALWKRDSRGLVTHEERPQNASTDFGFDLAGRMLVRKVTTAGGGSSMTRFGYDSGNGLLSSITHPDGTNESFSNWNPDGTVGLQTTRQGLKLQLGYSPDNRPVSRIPASGTSGPLPDGLAPLDAGDLWSWDLLGRPLSATRPGGAGTAVTWSGYDSAGRPKSETVEKHGTIERSWDAWGRPISTSFPSTVSDGAFSWNREFDNLDRLVAATPGSGAAPPGADWAWGGTSRLWGQTTRGPLRVAHRTTWLGGPGVQPPSGSAAAPALWRMGTLTIGALGASSADPILDSVLSPLGSSDRPGSRAWGQLGWGYRAGDAARIGRAVIEPPIVAAGGSPTSGAPFGMVADLGWSWIPDLAGRLLRADSGKGRLAEEGGDDAGEAELPPGTTDRYLYEYGTADELRSLSRQATPPLVQPVAGPSGRIAEWKGVPFDYDDVGRRIEDDRFVYRWSWRGELASVDVKPTWPGGVVPPLAGHRILYQNDATGRLLVRRQYGPLPRPGAPDGERPFVEERRFLWDFAGLVEESGWNSTGELVWRKRYVPGVSGLDDSPGFSVEMPGSDPKVYSFLRDDQQTVIGLVEERSDASADLPPTPALYSYAPFGEAHLARGPELERVRFDPSLRSVILPGGATASQTPVGDARDGGLVLRFLGALEPATLESGLALELANGGEWAPLPGGIAVGIDSDAREVRLIPLDGWPTGATLRLHVTGLLADHLSRVAAPAVVELAIPSSSEPVLFDWNRPRVFDSALASADTLGGQIPGGQNFLFQGAWTDPTTGIAYHRARWYDPRTQSWLSEDPEGDVDSPNLYAAMSWRVHELTDPLGLRSLNEGDKAELRRLRSIETGAAKAGDAKTVLAIQRARRNFIEQVTKAQDDEGIFVQNEYDWAGVETPNTYLYHRMGTKEEKESADRMLAATFLLTRDLPAVLAPVAAFKMAGRPTRASEQLSDAGNKGISNVRREAVRQFWEAEIERAQRGEPLTRSYTTTQLADLKTGKIPIDPVTGKPLEGHHMQSVQAHPEESGNPDNIYPATRKEHKDRWHGGDFRNDTHGVPRNPAVPEEF